MGVAAVENERRVVSVLFCDLVGSTAAAEDLDPEDVHLALSGFHHAVRDRVLSYGGVVEKYVGDAIMAIFGVPVAHEDDAERAVRAALALAEDAQAGRLPSIRVGVNTGEVLAVLGASPERGESTVLGDVVNTAARLQGAASVNTVVVGDVTHRATARVFEYDELAPMELKGKKGLVALWRPRAARARFGADVLRDLTTPMVGRDDELATLVDLFQRASAGGGAQLVTVVGEPGVGKSRIVAELLRRLDSGPDLVTWRQGRCPPYGAEVPYAALGDIVKAQLGVYDNDPADTVMAKLEAGVPGEEAAGLRALLAPLLGLPGLGQVGRETQFTAWAGYLTGLTQRNAAVLVVEDLHWADEGLLEFLPCLVGNAGDAPLLVVTTTRPELLAERPGWAGHLASAVQLTLSPLEPEDTQRLLSSILGDLGLGTSVREALVDRCGGNPLYAEEFARLARDTHDRGALELDALPDSLQSLISARLDTLPDTTRSLLQDTAVVGKTFWTGVAAALSRRDQHEVEQGLLELVRREFVRPLAASSITGQREWSFVHALIRDVAYQRLPRADRGRRHLVVAGWLGEVGRARIEDVADVVLHHALTAHGLASVSNDAALLEESRALAVQHGLMALGNPPGLTREQLDLLPRQIAPLVKPGTREEGVLLSAQTWIAVFLGAPGAVDIGRRAVEILRHEGQPADLAKALRLYALASAGDYEREAELLREAVATLEPHGPSAELVCDLADLAVLESGVDIVTTRVLGERALAMARELPLTGYAEGNARWRGLIAAVYGKDEADPQALELIDEAIEVSERWAPTVTVRLMADKVDFLGPQRGPVLAIEVAEAALSHPALVPFTYHQLRNAMLPYLRLAGRLPEAMLAAQENHETWTRMGTTDYANFALAHSVLAQLECGYSPVTIAGGEELLELTRRPERSGWDDLTAQVMLLSAVPLAASRGELERASSLMRDVPLTGTTRRLLPVLGDCLRVAAQLGAFDQIERLTATISEELPLGSAMLATARGLLLERSDPAAAAEAFHTARDRHHALGCMLEEAYAIHGLARCLDVLADPAARSTHQQAKELFTLMRSPQRVAGPSATG